MLGLPCADKLGDSKGMSSEDRTGQARQCGGLELGLTVYEPKVTACFVLPDQQWYYQKCPVSSRSTLYPLSHCVLHLLFVLSSLIPIS